MKKTIYLMVALMAGAVAVLTILGCGKKGPAEKVGETMDKAGESVKDAVTPDGPVEKLGKNIDKAVDRATD